MDIYEFDLTPSFVEGASMALGSIYHQAEDGDDVTFCGEDIADDQLQVFTDWLSLPESRRCSECDNSI